MPPLLQIKNLQVDFVADGTTTSALKNISFEITRGKVTAIVGESGSGKSVTSLSVLKLIPSPPVKYTAGEILFTKNRSEEHTSELQSHSEISYAVFCLKKKK